MGVGEPESARLLDDAEWARLLDDAERACREESMLERAPESLDSREVIDYLMALQRQRCALDALEARAMVVAAGTHRMVRGVVVYDEATEDERSIELVDEIREELASALHRSIGLVDQQIEVARILVGWLRPTLDALEAGRITAAHAKVLAEQALRLSTSYPCVHQPRDLDSPQDALDRIEFGRACDVLQGRVLDRAEYLTPGQVRSLARRAVASIDRAGSERRRQQARDRVDVQVYAEDDGLAVLLARMPMEQAAQAFAALEARARATGESAAPVGHRRVQALMESLCIQAQCGADQCGADQCGADQGGADQCGADQCGADQCGADQCMYGAATSIVRAEIQVTVSLDSLLGVDDEPASIRLGGRSPEPLTAAAVRALLTDDNVPAVLRRLVTDPIRGHVLDRGRKSYEVTAPMRAYLAARDATCRFPGCVRQAQACQVDHAVPWAEGGSTNRANLGHLCLRHHQLKTHGGWSIVQSGEDGTATWLSPHGRQYRVRPPNP